MPTVELPTLSVDAVAAIVATERPLLTNRDPGPDEANVPLGASVTMEIVDPGADGVAVGATKIWVDGALAFDGSVSPPIATAFGGPRALVTELPDTLRVTLDSITPFGSQAVIAVRVVAATKGAAGTLDETYSFSVEDRTAPRVVAGVATAPRTLRLAFDETVTASDVPSIAIRAITAPAVPLTVTGVVAIGSILEVSVAPEMTPDAHYVVVAAGVTDLHGNLTQPPYDRVELVGFRPARPLTRRFDLWSMLPKQNRRADLTGDLARFIACLQEVTDLLLADVDRFPDIFDIERAPDTFLDLLLRDLGNPFPFDLDTLGKRRLASVLVEMYRQKGTAPGVRNAVRFFLGVEIQAITGLAETALVLGESELGVDWEPGPSDRFARYAFSLTVGRVLTPSERRQLRAIVEYVKPAHTHFVDLVEPLPPVVPDHWEVGVSDLGETTLLH